MAMQQGTRHSQPRQQSRRQRWTQGLRVVRAGAALATLTVLLGVLAGGTASAQDSPAEDIPVEEIPTEVGPPIGKIPLVSNGVPVTVERGDGLAWPGACGRFVTSFVASSDEVVISVTDDETWFALYTVSGAEPSLAVDNCDGGQWERGGEKRSDATVTVEQGVRYWVAWDQEDQSETFAIDGQFLLDFIPERPLPNAGFFKGPENSGAGPLDVDGCRVSIMMSFVATDDVTWVGSFDNESWMTLFVIEDETYAPGLNELVPVTGCRNDSIFVESGSSYPLPTEPGTRYWLGVGQEDVREEYVLGTTSPSFLPGDDHRTLDDVRDLHEGEAIQIDRLDGVELHGACGRVVGSFTATQAETVITSLDNEAWFALYRITSPYTLDDVTLAHDNCAGEWGRNGRIATRAVDLEPGSRYLLVWGQEDEQETIAINGGTLLAFVTDLSLPASFVLDRGEGIGRVEVDGCVQSIVGSFVATDDVTYLWASDWEVNYSLWQVDDPTADTAVEDLTAVSGCRGGYLGWEPALDSGVSTRFETIAGERYWLALHQEDNQERFTLGPEELGKLPQAAKVNVSCLAGRGRVDVNLQNHTMQAAAYIVRFEGLAPRLRFVDASGAGRVSLTGRSAGIYDVSVEMNGELIVDQSVEVDCDNPSSDTVGDDFRNVTAISTCLAGRGFVRFQFVNQSDQPRSWIVDFEGVSRRSTTAAPWGQSVRGTSGRPNGVYQAVITSEGRVVDEFEVAVVC